jgi:hypothetical protein
VDATVADWGSSGLAYLTGMPGGPPDFSRSAVLARARRVADDIGRRTGLIIDAATFLAGRAALLGLRRRGQISAGGATRLLAGIDGWCALTLSRSDDVEAVPALLESSTVADDPWPQLQRWVVTRSAVAATERAHLLDIPAAVLGETPAAAPRVRRLGQPRAPRGVSGLLVADLSSMWAGPLCARLLAQAGATVVKVESRSRPDGTRAGAARFFDWVNSGKLSYAVDFDSGAGNLRDLLGAADVVIEGSRPAALPRRGLGPGDIAARPGRVWLRVTGHGSDAAGRIAFGDDAAVSGGLVGAVDNGPVFCGDAIADPLSGLEAALAVLDSLGRGGGELIEVSLAAVAATYAALPAGHGTGPAEPPRRPPAHPPAPALGADNAAVDALIDRRRPATC